MPRLVESPPPAGPRAPGETGHAEPRRSEVQSEVDGLREAIRLNWLEMERPDLMQIERQVIRANVAGIVQRIAGLLREPEA